MALSSCFIRYTLCVSLGIDHRTPASNLCNNLSERCKLSLENTKTGLFGLPVAVGGIGSCEIAASAFTWGTVAVLPCYALMVVAPRAEFTKKVVGSSIPYIGLGMLYAYLLYLSWTPDTIRIMFASKYLLPELPGIAKMFSSEITLASAWIHLLAVDLFAARQVYFDGLQENVETRHSVSICLLFCPIGILTHFITKALTTSSDKTENGIR